MKHLVWLSLGLICLWIGTWNGPACLAAGIDPARMQGWEIIVAEHAISSEQYAAKEFQTLFQQGTGLQLPIQHRTMQPTKHVFIGDSPEMRKHAGGFDPTKLGTEDLRIAIANDAIIIAGGPPRGTLYGVYQFLEDYLGVRFLTFDHTHVPLRKAGTELPCVDRVYRTPLQFRFSYYGENFAHPEFAARLRVNTVSDDPKLGGKTGRALISHTFGTQIPSQKYGQEHPEYFALRDGKRLAPVADDWFGTEPCLAHPEVLNIVTQHVLAELKANPKAENISVSQNDNSKYCQCEKCAALDQKEGTPMGSLLTFVNAVAERVEREHPQVKIGTLAYWYTRHPPKTVVPRQNVQIQLCSIECCLTHSITDPKCPLSGPFRDDMQKWGLLCKDIAIWNYNTNFSNYQLPNPNLKVIEPNIRYFVANHAKGIFMQAAGNTTGAEFSDLRNYLISRLLWDPQQSGQALIDEFLTLHYGPSAPPIRKFIQCVHDEAEASGKHRNCFGTLENRGLSVSIGDRGIVLFQEAKRLAGDEALRQRVEKASMCAYRAAIEPSWNLKQPQDLKPDVAAQQRPLVRKFFDLCKTYGVQNVSEQMTAAERLQSYRKLFSLKDSEQL